MRAYELITETRREPLTLRQLNSLKHQARRRERLDAERATLMQVMYRDHEHDRTQLDIERQRIELEQLKAELAQTRAETRKLDREADLKSRTQITKMAMRAMRLKNTD